MRRILIIGGYGGFGARLSRRLLAAGHEVLVAGRSLEKAQDFCRLNPGARPVRADRSADLEPLLRELRPVIVIDAAGPFQGCGYAVPRACIATGVSYLDLADARDFVCGIGELDEAAREASVVVISGASSIPALSGAIARKLAAGLDRVSQVEIAISASTRSTATRSVTGAILSYAGRPIRMWRGGRWSSGFGGSELRRMRFEAAGSKPLGRRWLSLCDVPDLSLLPATLPGRPSVTFRAGSDRPPQILGLWLASWLVRLGFVGSLAGLTRLFVRLQRAVLRVGSDRSAMAVTLRGSRGAERIERSWTMIAEKGSGPEVPTLAAALLVDAILAGRARPGAREASQELGLDDFEPLFAGLPLRHAITERILERTLYRRVMGEAFEALPSAVREMHEVNGDAGATGAGVVSVGGSLGARLLSRLMRFPPTGSYPVHVHFTERNGVETWTREFGRHRFRSVLRQVGRGITERFGPIAFAFELPSDEFGLRMILRGWSVFGLPMPLAFAPRIQAREWEEDGRFHFEVEAALPLIGKAIAYRGWLTRGERAQEAETERAARGRMARTALA